MIINDQFAWKLLLYFPIDQLCNLVIKLVHLFVYELIIPGFAKHDPLLGPVQPYQATQPVRAVGGQVDGGVLEAGGQGDKEQNAVVCFFKNTLRSVWKD